MSTCYVNQRQITVMFHLMPWRTPNVDPLRRLIIIQHQVDSGQASGKYQNTGCLRTHLVPKGKEGMPPGGVGGNVTIDPRSYISCRSGNTNKKWNMVIIAKAIDHCTKLSISLCVFWRIKGWDLQWGSKRGLWLAGGIPGLIRMELISS